MHNSTMIRLATIAASAWLAACSGGGQGLDAGGRPLAAGGVDAGPLVADFDSIQLHVFTPICTVCHAGGAAPQGLRLDATNSYALLVGVPSNEVSSTLRVKPGDPDNSYVIQKLEGHAPVGAQMPYGGPPLPAATIAVIRQWISAGAARATAVAAAPFAVVAVTPATHDVLFAAPVRIVIGFNRELDQTRLDQTSVGVEQLIEGLGVAVPVTLHVARGSASTLLLEPVQALASGRYRIVVYGPPATGVASIGGERLGRSPAGEVVSQFELVGQP